MVSSQGDARRIKLRYEARCQSCGRALSRGETALHDPSDRSVTCLECAAAVEAPPVERGPGASARREYERLRKNREDRIEAKYGRLGLGISRLGREPQHIAAWRKGGEGEEHVSNRLRKLLAGRDVELLDDRRIPGSRANIDHIAVGPGGVTVIDAKDYKGKVRVERTGGLFSPRRELLRIGGRDRTAMIEGVEKQIAVVRQVLEGLRHGDVPVIGALCLVTVDGLPLLGKLQVRGIAIDGPRPIAKLVRRDGTLESTDVIRIASELDARLPPA